GGRAASQAFQFYREGYRPSPAHPSPHLAICVWALAAETEAEAARLFTSREISRLWRGKGVFAALPSPEEAATYTPTEAENAWLPRFRAGSFYGTPDVTGSKLRALASEHGLEDVAILTTLHDQEARRRSYALLAAEFGLDG